MTVLTTERLVLRPFLLEDAEDLHQVFGNKEAMKYWSTLPHASIRETEALVRQTMQADPARHAEFVVEFEGRVIGKAGIWEMPEVGYILHPDYWRRGFGEEVLGALIRFGFEERKLAQITADVDPDNVASIAMLGKLGFRETGREARTIEIGGVWYDSVYFALDAPK